MKQTIFLIIVVGVVILGFGSIYTINEAEQAVVTQFGKPVGGAVTDAGIHVKLLLNSINEFWNGMDRPMKFPLWIINTSL
jgi:membrane protease subunit HflC